MKITEIWKESDGSWSWGRVASTFTLGSGIWAFGHVVTSTGHIPDAATLMGLATWMIAPYGVNKATTAFGKAENL